MFFDYELFLFPEVSFHLRLFWSSNKAFCMHGIDEETKTLDGKVRAAIEHAYFLVKVASTDRLKLSSETLLKSAAIYPYIENLGTGILSFKLDETAL